MDLPAMPYRGDDTNLNVWQRLLMLFVGIGGLWFIPTFHNITKLSPFLGALCVLALLWVVNEAFNRKLLNADQMIQQCKPRVLQYGSIQLILYVVGIMLALGAVKETGALEQFARWCDQNIHQVYLLGFISGLVSVTLDSFTTAVTFAYMHDVSAATEGYDASFALNGDYWKLIAYCTAVGGSILSVGSLSGVALMKMENMRMGWFLRHFSWRVLVGWLLGMAVLALGFSF
jgi:Na+/H+ antiporter NhaD/arsenite permease-like protein